MSFIYSAKDSSQRDQMEYDLLIVGGGPAGLSAAIKAKQLNASLNICLLEKGSQIGAHIISGAVFETKALDELIPDWKLRQAPLHTQVTEEAWHFLTSSQSALNIPTAALPADLHNQGNYIISLGALCQWLSEQATNLGVDIFPGFTAADILISENGRVEGVVTGDMGRTADGSEKPEFALGMELRAKYTLFCEGARGHLGKQLIEKFQLDHGKDPQHYGLGIKEVWQVPKENHREGLVIHSLGWPLSESNTTGGGFLYHVANQQIAVGLITDLSYSNPNVSPFDEFQRYKCHPQISKYLLSGERIAYGARAIVKGGLQSQPKMTFPGGLLLGDDAGTLNFAKIKGSHTAMKSGMLAAEEIVKVFESNPNEILGFEKAYQDSWAFKELYRQRNTAPAQKKFGNFFGAAYSFIDLHLGGKLPWTFQNKTADHETLLLAANSKPIDYPKADGKLSFDKLSSVYLSNTFHTENQPCHLVLKNPKIPIEYNLKLFDEPAQRYCPAGVYEVLTNEMGEKKFQINAQNCVHCKTCDIKDPTQNIQWVTPEGGGGPNYSGM